MNRRRFVAGLLGTAGSLIAGQDPPPDASVKRVLVMFKCHLDVGFVDTQAAIIRKYFDVYFPLAIETARSLRHTGDDRYVWTTGSWLLYEYLEQTGAASRTRMEQAIGEGSVAWHALPFTWQSELLNESAVTGAIGFSKSLDRRFGRKTTGAKMTDVPGHCRGLIRPLAQNGVTFLDIGVNSASTPPDVPDAFVWKDSGGNSVAMIYHQREYGGVVRIPKSDLAIAVEMRDDNAGPHTLEEIHTIYANLRRQFPKATVKAASLTEIANAVEPFRAAFPVVTQEIGDTWIYGVASDPLKLAHYRELLRLRTEWLNQGKFKVGAATDLAFLSKFALAVEHTWGTDTKTWLDFDHYTPDALASMLDQPKYKTVTGSWVEKRADIEAGVAALPSALRDEARARVNALKAAAPDVSGLSAHAGELETKHFKVALDPNTGAIIQLHSKAASRDWASAVNPLALFNYQTLSKADYDRFLASYITVQTDWAPKDFGKPNIESFGAQSRIWNTRLIQCVAGEDRLVAELQLDGAPSAVTAWPGRLYLELLFPPSDPRVDIRFTWLDKRSNRLPEALWLSFNPVVTQPRNWQLAKMDTQVSPFDVVSGGNRHMHAVSKGISHREGFELQSLDAALVVLGEMSPIYFSNDQPDLAKGFHFSLFNNGWGTNYVQWFGEDMRFRFSIRA
jgi:Domain of unknown function (DUF5054)